MKEKITNWIKEWFSINGPDSKAVIGISGGKDSTIVAKLCVDALGADRVIGVLMPSAAKTDFELSKEICEYLGIKYNIIDISNIISVINVEAVGQNQIEETEQAKVNLPARIRMSLLYYVAQCVGGRVANTCNRSEGYVGFATRWGDDTGDFAPIRGLTVTELREFGLTLGLPEKYVLKTPIDGLNIENGEVKTDEDVLGFSYEQLDKLILTGSSGDANVDAVIMDKHQKTRFKENDLPEPCLRWSASSNKLYKELEKLGKL